MLRVLNRLWAKSVCRPFHVPTRGLTATETATALRPFYFAVHPDLFGKYPMVRENNEKSLKQLNEYIECLHNRQKVQPVSLLFYLRQTTQQQKQETKRQESEDRVHFQTVRISLLSECVHSTVSSILRTCHLPLEYINSIPKSKNGTAKSDRPIKWDPSFYAAYGIPNPDVQPRKQAKDIDTLSYWLKRNIAKAHKHQRETQGIRLEIERLQNQLLEETGLADVEWACGWGLTQYRASLMGLLRVYRRNKHLIDLKDQSLMFGHVNGICSRGNIIVKSNDLADSWLPMLKSIGNQSATLRKLPGYESVLSHLLNQVSMVRQKGPPFILAEEYLVQLKHLSSSLEKYLSENSEHRVIGDLRDVDLVVECAQSPLYLNNAGQILIPYSCPVFLIVDFLNDNADTARQMKHDFQKKASVIKELVKSCQEELGLKCLSKEPNITCEQMETCCNKLLSDSASIGPSVEGCHIRIAQFYSVMSDGEIYIPWNWKRG